MPDFLPLIELYKTRKTSGLKTSHPEFYQYLCDVTPFLTDVSSTQRLWHVWNNQPAVPKCATCTNPVNWDIVNQTYRTYCCTACSSVATAARHAAIAPIAPLCANVNCDKPVSKHSRGWRECCSPKCSREHATTFLVSHDQMIEFITALPVDFNFRGFVQTNRSIHNTIEQYTTELPTSYQTSDRVNWLLGRTVTRNELLSKQLEELGVQGATSLTQARAIGRGNPTCASCGGPRHYNLETNKYPKYCSDPCKQVASKKVAIKRLCTAILKVNKTRVIWNKNDDVRLNDPAWLSYHHHELKWTKRRIAYELQVDKETISNRFNQFGIKAVRHPSNGAEVEICEFLRSIGLELVTNSRKVIGPRELDIFVPSHNIAIEYCGLYWHCDVHDRITRQYHREKMLACQAKGIRLITIFEDEWLHKRDIVTAKLTSILGKYCGKRVFARNTTVSVVTTAQRRRFLNAHHIQGEGHGSLNMALKDSNQEIVAVMTMQQLQDGKWMLNRFATSCSVVGGFSKLLNWFKSTEQWSSITTFADQRWSNGQLYVDAGFDVDGQVAVDYSYIIPTNTTRMHKFNFRRDKLAKRLGRYDPTLSETANMKINHIERIWDCGKIRFKMTNVSS